MTTYDFKKGFRIIGTLFWFVLIFIEYKIIDRKLLQSKTLSNVYFPCPI